MGIAGDGGKIVELMADGRTSHRGRRHREGSVPDADDPQARVDGFEEGRWTASSRRCVTWPRPSASSRRISSSASCPKTPSGGNEARVMDAIVSRMTDRTIAHFVSKDVIANNGTPTDRLAEAFQTLVRNPDDRHRLPQPGPRRRRGVRRSARPRASRRCGTTSPEKLLTSYSDETFVSGGVRARAVGRPHASGGRRAGQRRPARAREPSGWTASPPSALRSLDLHLLLDLLRLEQDDGELGRADGARGRTTSRTCCSSATSTRPSSSRPRSLRRGCGHDRRRNGASTR